MLSPHPHYSPQLSLPCKLSDSTPQSTDFHRLHTYYRPICCPPHPPHLNHHINVTWGEGYKLRSSSLRHYIRPFVWPTSSYNKIIMSQAVFRLTVCSWTVPVWLVPSILAQWFISQCVVLLSCLSSACSLYMFSQRLHFVGDLVIKHRVKAVKPQSAAPCLPASVFSSVQASPSYFKDPFAILLCILIFVSINKRLLKFLLIPPPTARLVFYLRISSVDPDKVPK
jgi:hypothetical protein